MHLVPLSEAQIRDRKLSYYYQKKLKEEMRTEELDRLVRQQAELQKMLDEIAVRFAKASPE